MSSDAAKSARVSDLMALAIIRRILLELGHETGIGPQDEPVGALELWMHQPLPDLDGRSPLQVLQAQDGETALRQCLAVLAATGRHTGPASP